MRSETNILGEAELVSELLARTDAVLIGFGDAQTATELAAMATRFEECFGIRRAVAVLNPSVGNLDAGAAGLVVMDRNKGYAAALNAGLRAVDGSAEFVIVVTNDCEISAVQLETLVRSLADDSTLWAVGPRLSFRNSSGSSHGGYCARSGRIGHHRKRAADNQIDWLDGACVAFRQTALDVVSPLPETLFLYFEDTLLGLSIRRSGGRLHCDNTITVEQDTGRRSRPLAFGYFDSRNRLLLSDLDSTVSRPCQLVICFIRILTAAALSLYPTPKRGGRQRQLLLGRTVGLFDGLRGLGGPPPAWIRRRNGITGV